MGNLKMKKSSKKQRVQTGRHGDRPLRHNKRKRSTIPVAGIIRNIGSGVLKVFLFLSVLTAISLTFVMLYNYLLTSPYMKLAHVEVRGVDKGIRNELLQMCGLTSEQGLLSLKLEALKKRDGKASMGQDCHRRKKVSRHLDCGGTKRGTGDVGLDGSIFLHEQTGTAVQTGLSGRRDGFSHFDGSFQNRSRPKRKTGSNGSYIERAESAKRPLVPSKPVRNTSEHEWRYLFIF